MLVFIQSHHYSIQSETNLKSKQNLGVALLVFVILYLGSRPISFVFGDMGVYASEYKNYAEGDALKTDKDVFFEYFMRACSKVMSAEFFFLLCAFLYIYPLFIACKKMFDSYWFYGFFMLVLSFSFWAYGTNGIRNGIATSIFILGISQNKKILAISWIVLSIFIHKSLLLPAVAYIATMYYRDPRMYLKFWLLAIPLSLALGGFWEHFFLGLGFGEEERLTGYLSSDSSDLLDQIVEIKTGFRWDFILYSATGVYGGWYFVIKKKFEDLVYNQLFSMYLITNGLWILVIRANFSNRFAYLSWFILGLVIIYPLLKVQFSDRQHQTAGKIIFLYFMFTYVMNVLLVK